MENRLRTRRITFLANDDDARKIEGAAAQGRMTLSTFCLLAALDKACEFSGGELQVNAEAAQAATEQHG